jgi:hypothetical protein
MGAQPLRLLLNGLFCDWRSQHTSSHGADGIVNNSTSTQTVASNLTLGAAQTFRAAKPSPVFPPFQSIETKFHFAQIDPAVPGLVGFGKSRLETMVAHPEILVLDGDPLQQARLAEFFHMTRHHIRIASDMAGDSLDAELPIAVQRGQNFQAIHFSNQTHQFGTIGYGGLVVAFAGPCQSGVVGCGVVQVTHGLILQIFEVESTLWVVSFTQKSKFRLRYEDSLWQRTKYRYICEENLMSISKNQCVCEDNKSKTLKNPLGCEDKKRKTSKYHLTREDN